MRHLLYFSFILQALIVFFGTATALAQNSAYCPPGQTPHFSHGFAFLKHLLGEVMGEPLECEHFDALGNAYQKTTTGQAFYRKDNNTPMFTAGNRRWAWTPAGLRQWSVHSENITANVTSELDASYAVKVMSYNVLFGAGANPYWEQRAAQLRPFSYPGNRLPAVLSIIKAAEPDILGLQEAAGWDQGTPPIVQQVTDELGMNYFLAPTKTGLHLALFTKFKILAAENLSEQIGNVGALRATLATTDLRQPLHVFVVHLDPFSAETRASEIARLTQAMAPYQQSATILMGDTNITCLEDLENCQEYRLLSQAGWHLVIQGEYQINQIWTSPGLDRSVKAMLFPGASFEVSDHLPVGAAIEIFLPL